MTKEERVREDEAQAAYLERYALRKKVKKKLKKLKKEVNDDSASKQKLEVMNNMLGVLVNWNFTDADIIIDELTKSFTFYFSEGDA